MYRAAIGRKRGMRMIPAYYRDVPNMGDQLNPLIIGRLLGYGILPVSMGRAKIFAIGSYLGMLAESRGLRHVAVWGTGFISYGDAEPSPDLDVDYRAVRGELTKRRLERLFKRKLDIPTGDPGLLSSMLLDRPEPKEYDLGIIPHFRERDDPRFAQLLKLAGRTRIIDVTQHPLAVVRQIASCRRILSSSLHGLIISDSLGIPNLHIKVTDRLMGDGFKFDDYYSAFGVAHEFVDLNAESIESLGVIDRRYRITPEAVAAKQRQLLEAFPFPRQDEMPRVRISLVALLFPWGLVRLWATWKFGEDMTLSSSRRSRFGVKRIVKFVLPFGVVAILRSRRFREPLGEIMSVPAFFRVLKWRW